MDVLTFCQVNVVNVSYGVDGDEGIEIIVLYNIFGDGLTTFNSDVHGTS